MKPVSLVLLVLLAIFPASRLAAQDSPDLGTGEFPRLSLPADSPAAPATTTDPLMYGLPGQTIPGLLYPRPGLEPAPSPQAAEQAPVTPPGPASPLENGDARIFGPLQVSEPETALPTAPPGLEAPITPGEPQTPGFGPLQVSGPVDSAAGLPGTEENPSAATPGLREETLAMDQAGPQEAEPAQGLTEQYTQEVLDDLEMRMLRDISPESAEVPPPGDSFTIRLSLFSVRDNALKALVHTRDAGYAASVTELPLEDGGAVYDLLVGGFATYEEAQTAAVVLSDSENREVRVIGPVTAPKPPAVAQEAEAGESLSPPEPGLP